MDNQQLCIVIRSDVVANQKCGSTKGYFKKLMIYILRIKNSLFVENSQLSAFWSAFYKKAVFKLKYLEEREINE